MIGRPLVAVLALALAAGALRAQQTGPLDRVDSLASVGRADAARAALKAWQDSAEAHASRRDREQALWLRARVTPDPAQAELDYERLLVEYPGGPYSDRALFRLAQKAFVAGDSAGAHRRIAEMGRDYPGSLELREARAWLRSVGRPPPPAEPEPAGASRPASARTVAAEPARARPAASGSSASEAPARAAGDKVHGEEAAHERAPERSTASASHAAYAVQLGAFTDLSRARTLAAQAGDAGLDARIVQVRGSHLVRVRTGRFDSAASARELLAFVERLGFRAVVVGDVRAEEPVRR